MAVKGEATELPGLLLITPGVFPDTRGYFMEVHHARKYAQLGIARPFVQDNHSHSCRRTLRGLHYQLDHPQAKLVWAVSGSVFDVAVDIRLGSPTYGKWFGTTLSEDNHCQLYVPEGFAHGFCVLSEDADILYKCTGFYAPEDDRGIAWDDPSLGIDWPVDDPLLSAKDSRLPRLDEVPPSDLPVYRPG